MIDLHTHSKASDGSLSPDELATYAAGKGLDVWALTDHDTTSGLQEAAVAAAKHHIQFIPGIELNIDWYSGEFHLLGLGLTTVSAELAETTEMLRTSRNDRNIEIIEKMASSGFPVSKTELCQLYPQENLGRPHIAAYLTRKGICKTLQQAFDLYLGKGRPFYVHRKGADLDAAISAIKKSGGIPVLAHPLSLYISWGKIEPVLKNLHERGIEGLEAFHSGVKKTEALRLEEIAHRTGFFVTGGSDFHGEHIRKDRKIGYACNGEKIPERLWTEELLPRLQALHSAGNGSHRTGTDYFHINDN